MNRRLLLRLVPPAVLLFLTAACTTVPEETEKARGVLSGVNLVLAMSVLFIVAAVGLIAAVLVIERAVRTRGRLAEGMPVVEEEEEPADEVVAGITVGRATVPRWLYGAYVLIPVFAFAYVLTNIAPAETAPGPTEAPIQPCTDDCEIAAEAIAFTKDAIPVVAESDLTVTFNNTDAVVHNFYVWETKADTTGGDPIANTGATVAPGASDSAEFESPPAGESYYFNCTLHPAMEGDIESVAAAG